MKKVHSQLILDCQLPSRKTVINRNSSLKSLTNPYEKQANNLSLHKVGQNIKNKYAPSSNLLIDTQNITFYKGESQSQVISLQNQGKNLLKVCLSYPKTKYFTISQEDKNFQLPSGMSKKISIWINSKAKFDDESYSDEVYIATQNSKDKIKLVWLSQKPLLNYENLVNLKTLDLGRLQKFNISLENRSTTTKIAKIRLIKDPWDNIQVSPDQFSLEPRKIMKIEIGLNPQFLGAYHHKVVVEVDDNLMKPIQIIYAAIDFAFKLENSKQQRVIHLDFGDLLRGSKKQLHLYAHNNSPNEIQIKSKIKIGESLRAESTLQSPQELGIQFSSTVIEILNKNLKIAPFSRKKLTLVAESPVEDRHRLLVDRLAVSENVSSAMRNKIYDEESVHRQILVCEMTQISKNCYENESNQKSNTLVLPMQARFSLPLIKITPNNINLGKVFVGGTIQSIINIQNLSNKLKVSIQVNKLFSFDLLLMTHILDYKQSTQMKIFLKGTNIGVYKVNAEIIICNIYTIRIPIEYEVVNANATSKNQQRLWKTGHNSLHNASEDGIDFNKTLASVTQHKSKSKYDRINFRRCAAKSKSSKSLLQKDERQTDIQQSLRNSTKGKQNTSKEKLKMEEGISCGLNQAKLSMSSIKSYNLFVTKKIDKYLPYQQLRQHKKLQKTKNTKEYFNNAVRRSPKNRKQAEQIQRQLSPQQLKLITISQKIINFGKIFIKSRIQKEFIIGNNTQSAIIAQLHHTSNDTKKIAFLSQSDMEPQIISQNGAARFRIIFNALYCGKFQSTLSYTINGVHTFHLLVEVDVELVSLNISKNSLKMAYLDDISQILLKDNFVLKNQGNIPAKFNIVQSSNKYIIQPESGILASGENMTVWVMQNNENYPIVQAGDVFQGKLTKTVSNLGDDRILIKIADGNDISLKILANPGLSDPRCIVKESKIIFGCTIVSKSKSKTFQLKNMSRSICLFEIFNQECEEFLTFDCMKGRVPPEGAKDITITYKSNLLHSLSSNFQILIRGGLIINVPIQAQSVAPQVSIIQSQFNFGDVCCDTAAVKTITIKNQSQTLIQLYADLRNNRDRGAQFLTISLWNSTTTPVGQKIKQVTTNYRSASFEEEIIDNAIKQSGVHKIRIDSKSILSFYLVYKPIAMGYYEFVLPLFLQNFIRNQELSKIVSCNAIEPKFIIEPNIIKFKKKIINDKENSCFHPYVQYLILKNPTDKVLKWKLDVHGQHKTNMSFSSYSSVPSFGNKKEVILPKICFQIEEKRGQLKPKDSVSINVSFNPLQQGFYCHKIPLFIFNQQKGTYHQQAQIRLEGEGKYPSLYFNRRQLIMPVVPVGIQSISMLQIYNEGYETINLKHRFQIMDSQGNIYSSKGNLIGENNFPQIIAVFPEGNKLTMNKRQAFVILKFVAKKSISFTCKFQIYDESVDCRTYSINISGTADNSLLTTFTYLSDTENIFRLEPSVTDFVDNKKNQKSRSEEMNSSLSVVLKINDGRNLVDRYHSIYEDKSINYYGLDCRIIKRWLNNFFREEKVREFPIDLSQNKEILLKLLYKLTGKKQFQGNWEFQIEGIGKQILNGENNSLTFYEQILRLLKTMGCLLNHIRPYYLLQKQDYLQYMGKDQNWMMYSDYYTKKYDIIYCQAWIVLFYQIIEQFWCGRIRCQTSSKVISNVYSNYQLQVIRWVKGIYEEFNQLQDSKGKFLSFGDDFKDCVAPIFCLMKYNPSARKTKSLQNLNRKPISPNQFTSNTKILYQMLEKLNIVPLIYEDQYQLCKEKQVFMFMYQLYELLPQTIPKLPPILFACELGENCSRIIDIKNPSNKAVHYWVKLQGCKDFTFDEKQSIFIEPKAVYPFKVDYKSRLSTEQSALISFFSKQQAEANSINGSALVFELKSKITGRKSLKKLQNISSPLYESTSIKILVENIFEDHQLANFSITLFQQLVDSSSNSANLVLKKKQNTTQTIQNILDKDKDNNFHIPIKPTAFYTECESLKIKKGSATSFDLFFTPLKLSKTKCFIIFNDPNVGQFQYQILGISQIPKPLQEIKHQSNIYVGNKDYLDLSLSVYNSYMLKCQSYYQQRNIIGSARKNMIKDKTQEKYRLQLNMDAKINDYITFPSQVILKTSKKDQFGGIQHQNKIKIQYNFPHILKDLTLDFLLIGDPKKDIQDVRRFKISLNIVHKPLSQELIMTTTARKPICQLIPLDNTSGKDWKIKAVIVENQNGWLSLKQGQKINNKQLIVKKGQAQSLSLCFEPKWIGKIHGKINIHNVTTNEQLIFIIRGVSQQPLSQNHFFLKVNTQDSTLFTVPIINPYNQRINFRILSDIDELQLPPQITMEPNEQIQFNFIAETISTTPQIGFLKFIDENGRFFWYTVTLECSQKKLRQFSVEIVTEVDKQIQKLVQFKNPYNKTLKFKCQYPKQYYLQAKQQFFINPHSIHQYKIKFKPVKQMNTQISLKVFNKDIGNFIYHIRLIAKQQAKRKIHTLSVEVGKIGSFDFKLQNNFKEPIKVNCQISNKNNFQMEIPEFLNPHTENVCRLKFKPSAQGKQTCNVKISGEHFPTKLFEIEGSGIAPYSIQIINFKAHINQTALEIIKFNNPNPKKTLQPVKVCLSQADHGCFRLVNHSQQQAWSTEVKDLLVIPVQFQPKQKGYFQSVLTIQSFNYQWKYLLRGNTGFKQTEKINQQVNCTSKQEIIKLLKIPIPEYINNPVSYFNKVEIDHQDKTLLKGLRSWMKLKLNNCTRIDDGNEVEEKIVTVYLKFKPKKVFKEMVKLVLSNSHEQGPKINYNLQINIAPCGPENVIPLEITAIKVINLDLNIADLGLKQAENMKTKMMKSVYCEVEKINDHIRLKFKPNHLIFNRNRVYIDYLVIESDEEEWNFEVQFSLRK